MFGKKEGRYDGSKIFGEYMWYKKNTVDKLRNENNQEEVWGRVKFVGVSAYLLHINLCLSKKL